MKKFEFEFDLRFCLEVPPPEGDEGGGTGSSGSGDNQGAGGSDDEGKKPIGDNSGGDIIEPDPLWPPVGI